MGVIGIQEDRHIDFVAEAMDHGRDLACAQIGPFPLRGADDQPVGLDFGERYRNLPYVGVLDPDLAGEA